MLQLLRHLRSKGFLATFFSTPASLISEVESTLLLLLCRRSFSLLCVQLLQLGNFRLFSFWCLHFSLITSCSWSLLSQCQLLVLRKQMACQLLHIGVSWSSVYPKTGPHQRDSELQVWMSIKGLLRHTEEALQLEDWVWSNCSNFFGSRPPSEPSPQC